MNRLNLITLVPESDLAIIFFRNDRTRIALYPLKELAVDINPNQPLETGRGFCGITLTYNTKSADEVDEIMKRAESEGATICKQPQRTEWGGYGGYFTDLDG